MSNYFQIIQNISKEFIGKEPSTFSDITDKKYKDIIKEVKESLNDFMLDNGHKFREKIAVFNTVENQQGYSHVYGNIQEDGLSIENEDAKDSILDFDSDWKEFIRKKNTETAGKPNKYTVAMGQILLSPIPDDTYAMTVFYDTHYFVKGIYAVDAESAAEQDKLYLTSTTGLSAGSVVVVEPETANEETLIVESVTTDDYIVATTDLTLTHASGCAAVVYKSDFVYETDEPNFPVIFHKIIEYMALMRLYYDDQDNLRKYTTQYANLYKSIINESKGTKASKLKFSV